MITSPFAGAVVNLTCEKPLSFVTVASERSLLLTCTFALVVSTGVRASLKVVYSSYSAAGEFKIGAVFLDLDEAVATALGRFATSS